MRRGLAVLLVLFGSTVANLSSANAQSDGPWTFEPATVAGPATQRTFFDYSLAPGDAIQDFVRLANGTDHDITFAIYGADAYTTPQGAFALRLRDQPRTGVGSWVSVPFTTRTVASGTAVNFPFQLGVPRDIEPGDWAGGVVAVATDASTGAPNANVKIEQGVGARIYVRVKGPLRPSLAITKLDTTTSGGAWSPIAGKSRTTFTFEIVNTGNVRLKGTARLDVVDFFGRTVKSFTQRDLPELLPHDSVTITEAWDGLPLLSVRLHPRLEVRAADVTTTREAPRFWHVAVPILFVAALLIAFVVLLGRRLARSATRLRHRAKALVPA